MLCILIHFHDLLLPFLIFRIDFTWEGLKIETKITIFIVLIFTHLTLSQGASFAFALVAILGLGTVVHLRTTVGQA